MDDAIRGWTQSSSSGYDLQIGNVVNTEEEISGVKLTQTIPPFFTAGSSQNYETDGMERHFNIEKGSVANTKAVCRLYRVNIDIGDSSLTLHPGFVDSLRRLDEAAKIGSINQKKECKDFIRKYGTHYASETVMGTSFTMETRYSGEETKTHTKEQLKYCHTKSGFTIFGIQFEENKETCAKSLQDTTKGTAKYVERFTSTFLGSFPAVGENGKITLQSWSQQLQDKWNKGTISPYPLQRKMNPILNILYKDAVKNISHSDGTPISQANIISMLAPFYGQYCEHMNGNCHVGCSKELALIVNGESFLYFVANNNDSLPNFHGRKLYHVVVTNDNIQGMYPMPLYLYYGSDGWLVSPNIGSIDQGVEFKTIGCPQIQAAFQENNYLLTLSNIKDFETCSSLCKTHKNCNFWQWNVKTKVCHFANSTKGFVEENNTISGRSNCPHNGDIPTLFDLCPEKGATSGMWIRKDESFFDPIIQIMDAEGCLEGEYKVLNDSTRNANHVTGTISYCDSQFNGIMSPDWQDSGWYRMVPPAGTQIPETVVQQNQCGTTSPGWLNGKHPTEVGQVVNATVCFTQDNNNCHLNSSNWDYGVVKIKKCPTFYLYYLPEIQFCSYRYCGIEKE